MTTAQSGQKGGVGTWLLKGVVAVLLTFLVVYIFIQISVLSNRVMRLTQELAIRRAEHEQPTERHSAEARG